MADKPIKVKVARGRSLQHGSLIITDEEKKTGHTVEKTYKAGEELELSPAEAKDLMALGFLEDPNAEPAPLPQGARVGLVSSERR